MEKTHENPHDPALVIAVLVWLAAQSSPLSAAATEVEGDLSGEDLIALYAEALGGEEAIRTVTVLDREGDLVVESAFAGLSKGRFEMTVVPGERVYRASDFGPFSTTTVWDGKAGWEKGPAGLRTLEGEELRQLQLEAHPFFFAGIGWPEGVGVERLPDREADGNEHYVVEIEAEAGSPITLYLDKETHLLRHAFHTVYVESLGETEVVTDFFDYRAHSGVQLPDVVGLAIEGVFSSEVTFDRTTIGGEVDPSRFAMPEQGEAP